MTFATEYRECRFCVMDTSNPAIKFDSSGQCNCCLDALSRKEHEWWPNAEGESRLTSLTENLRAAGRGKQYDAMIGLSGGIDSAYLAHLVVKKMGLRVLAVHVDGGWNSEPAVHNIERLVRALDLDLHTYVVEWQEMRDLQLAFLKSSVVNQDIPQDHAFFSTLYRTAVKFDLRHFLSGVNFASENVVGPGWGHSSMDGKHAKAIHERFGSVKLRSYPFMKFTEYLWLTRIWRQLEIHRPLNFVDYNKNIAQEVLRKEYGWRDYGEKHCESRFTKFYQEILLPQKFSYDKRRMHLSSLIVSGQLTKREAVEVLRTPIVSAQQRHRDLRFIAKKLGIAVGELETIIDQPPVNHTSYPNQMSMLNKLAKLRNLSRQAVGALRRARYS